MKALYLLVSIGACLCLPAALAENFTDDFNRADTDMGTRGTAVLGEQYTIHRGAFSVNDGNLATAGGAVGDKVIVLEHIRPSLNSGEKLLASFDFMIPEAWNDIAVGLAFDYAIEGEQRRFLAVRFRGEGDSQTLQFISAAPEEPVEAKSITSNLRIEPGNWYTLKLSTDAYPNLEYNLSDKEGGEVASGVIDLSGVSPFGGAVAIVVDGSDGNQVRFDNFSVSSD